MLGLQEARSTENPTTKTYSLPKMTSTCSGSLFPSTELLENCCMAVPISVTQDIVKCENEEKPLASSPTQGHTKEQGTETFPELTKDLKSEPVSELIKFPSSKNTTCMEELLNESVHKIQTQIKSISVSNADSVQSLILLGHQNEQPVSLCCSTPSKVQYQSIDLEHYVKSENAKKLPSNHDESPEQSDESATASKSLLKVIASAYMNCKQPAQVNWAQNKRALPPRKVSPRAPVQTPIAVTSLNNSGNQPSEKASDCNNSDSMQTVEPSNTFPKKSLISMTKIVCPVVALETHQKLISENIEGKHQCGLCRRVFQDMDSLIMHHALHRKEKVKFCRHCHEFVLSVPSSQVYHDCFSSSAGTFKSFFTTLHLNSKKLFQCLLCKRTYTRRHRLKVHKCQIAEDPARKTSKVLMKQQLSTHANAGLKTEKYKTKSILHANQFQSGLSKGFPPFLHSFSKTTLVRSMENVMVGEKTEDDFIDKEAKNTDTSEGIKKGQWTVPLDDAEVDVISDDECSDTLNVCKEKPDEEVIIVESAVKHETKSVISNKDIRVHISDLGVRRFSCNRCQRSYARRFTLIQHLKICRTGWYMERKFSTNVKGAEKMFPCPQCGSSFTRKDNMKMHLKRCQLVRPYSMGRNMIKQNQESNDNMFVLPPGSQNQVRQDGGNNGGADSGSWGIMSLPAVLPRRVTCECGAAFTCPKLLFEHLQKHAQESYICSQCGDHLHSWADLEAHQKLHVQGPRQNIQDQGSPQQQSHMQPQVQQVPCFQSSKPNLKVESQNLRVRLNHKSFTGPYICHRCKKVFRLRKSLLRHLSRSCKGDTAVQNELSCTCCGMAFQNSLALDAHVHLNTCRPVFKPLRCPVCVRWFSSLEGLKRHLLSHSQQEDPICQICDYKCSSHLALEEHKKSVHGINRVSESSTVQSATISQSSSSKAFSCQICHRTYPKLQSLKDHVRKVHRPKTLMSFDVGTSESKPDIQLLTKSVHQSQSEASLQSSVQPAQQRWPKYLKCQICTCTFSDIQSLNNHKRTVHILGGGNLQSGHSNLFQCQVCARSYPDISSLRNHRRRVHHIIGGLEMYKGLSHQIQDRPFKCQLCLRTYPHLASLKKHRRRVHRIANNAVNQAKVDTTHMKQSPTELPSRAPIEPVKTVAV